MAQMYQNMGWGSASWNPQMAWQQMMANMSGGAGGMDMGMMGTAAGMAPMAMGSMSPPGHDERGAPPLRYPRGSSQPSAPPPRAGLPSRPVDDYREPARERERSPRPVDRAYRRERSPSPSRSDQRRYDSSTPRNRY
jgi:hypothetical protein